MSLTACALCHREALRDRWIGGLHGVFCDLCGSLYIPESTPAIRAESPLDPDQSSGPADPATVALLSLAVT